MKAWKTYAISIMIFSSMIATFRAHISFGAQVTCGLISDYQSEAKCSSLAQNKPCTKQVSNSILGTIINHFVDAWRYSYGYFQTSETLGKLSDFNDYIVGRIKQKNETENVARGAAVRYLGTLDCRNWPEAQDALVSSLRRDRDESVRLEAALALRDGCCCTIKTTTALSLTVFGKDVNGIPCETSVRVKATAVHALILTLARTYLIPSKPKAEARPPNLPGITPIKDL